jgi:tellurite resistance-related uncharacterized protein
MAVTGSSPIMLLSNDGLRGRESPLRRTSAHTPSTTMKTIPSGFLPYKRTPEFTAETLPEGLRRAHRTRAGVWGKIVVLEGRLRYRILEPSLEETVLTPGVFGVVEPTVPHEVEPLGEVRFYVEFHARPVK